MLNCIIEFTVKFPWTKFIGIFVYLLLLDLHTCTNCRELSINLFAYDRYLHRAWGHYAWPVQVWNGYSAAYHLHDSIKKWNNIKKAWFCLVERGSTCGRIFCGSVYSEYYLLVWMIRPAIWLRNFYRWFLCVIATSWLFHEP